MRIHNKHYNLVPAGEEHIEKESEDEDGVGDVLHPVDLLREVDVRDTAQLACILRIIRICFLLENFLQGDFLAFLCTVCTFFNTASSAAP
jgi:hypothetical protein